MYYDTSTYTQFIRQSASQLSDRHDTGCFPNPPNPRSMVVRSVRGVCVCVCDPIDYLPIYLTSPLTADHSIGPSSVSENPGNRRIRPVSSRADVWGEGRAKGGRGEGEGRAMFLASRYTSVFYTWLAMYEVCIYGMGRLAASAFWMDGWMDGWGRPGGLVVVHGLVMVVVMVVVVVVDELVVVVDGHMQEPGKLVL
ncbi:hypothetical protein BZA05DRAFT_265128 [Tricharina praecox]|uniref:uncharacterized protein n=1 Tax=Tricharina praecox TaxID=43433 RepID=UPI0022208A62|nr:uncharacterized protein BZA05DRAFT_265128 [Tricharina praecox]KAI5854419.1 hypothetical protein BZA05DRAFT_265128 [Tricharina praecox]